MMRRLVGLLVLLTLAAGVWAVDARRQHDAAAVTITAVNPGPSFADYQPGRWTKTVFVLLIGSDERGGLEGARGDALHVVGLNPGAGRATIIDVPRDTWVDIPGRGQGRINEAYRGGPALQAATVQRLTGAPISYVVTTTFAGFKAMVNAIGGVNVQVPYLMSDPNSGAAFNPGMQHFDGAQALAFSRNRHIQDGDLVRTAHQGQLLVHALSDLRVKGTSATDVLHYLDILYRNVHTVGIGPIDLFRLARAALAVEPANVRNYPMPASIGWRGKLSVVFVRQPAATGVFRDFADDGVLQAH